MSLFNYTPFPAAAFEQYDLDGALLVVIAVRGRFSINLEEQNAPLSFLEEQPQFLWEDRYYEKKEMLHLIQQADFIPFKPGTDVTLLGFTYPPNNKPVLSWTTGLKVGEREKILRVYGKRFWEPISSSSKKIKNSVADYKLSKADPTIKAGISWFEAFGGQRYQKSKTEIEEVDLFNPIGIGWIHQDDPVMEVVRAPSFELLSDPITDWRKRYEPASFAPVAPAWRWRQQYAGTYDDAWKETRHPLSPRDFDYRFWQCAPPDQIFTPYLGNGESIQISNLHPEKSVISFTLPEIDLHAQIHRGLSETEILNLVLDGVHINIFDPNKPYVDLTWRVNALVGLGVKKIELFNAEV